jgi:CRP/FNR family cyclic AMP-dependent transcriptional regulator
MSCAVGLLSLAAASTNVSSPSPPVLELAELLGEERGSGRILIGYKIKRGDLAAMAGVAVENVSRVMNDWMQRKVVTRSSGHYCLENIATLESQVRS